MTSTDRRGAEVFAVDLARGLRAGGREIATVALRGSDGPGLGPDVEILGHGRTRAPRTLWRLRDRVRRAGPVIAHGSDALLACAVTTFGHPEGFVYRLIGDPRYWSPSGIRHRRTAWLLRRATAVVVLSPRFVDVVVGDYGVRRERCSVIPNAVDVDAFPLVGADGRRAARSMLDLDESPVVAYVGALSPEKNPVAAVRTIAFLDDATLLVAGDGPLREVVADAGERLAPGRVRLLGARTDVATVYAAADAVVVPSRTEGVPAVAIEAALSGVPVVAYDVGATGDVVVDGVTGTLVASGDEGELTRALREMLARASSFDGVSVRRHGLERFSIDEVVRAWERLLRTIEAQR